MLNIPNLFIVGAPKAGTTSLYEYLKKSPEVFMSPIKEPQFFSSSVLPSNRFWKPIRNKKQYFALFDKVSTEKIIGEASTTYLYDPNAPGLINELNPDSKIIIIIRDPVERTFSNWLHLKRIGEYHKILKSSFNEQIRFELNSPTNQNIPHLRLYIGNYSQYIKRYFELFGKEQVKVLIFEEFTKNLTRSMKQICEFLGIKFDFVDLLDEVHNPYVGPKNSIAEFFLHNSKFKSFSKKFFFNKEQKFGAKKFLISSKNKPKINDVDSELLIKYFSSDVKDLEKLLDKKLFWKNFSF